MTDKRPTPDESAGKSRRKRATPTIDLHATEVPPAAAADDTSGQAPPEPEYVQSADTESAAPAHPAPEPESEAAETADRVASGKPDRQGFALTGPVLAAGVTGALAMSLMLVGLWLSGILPIRYSGTTALRARVAGLEMRLNEFKERPAPVASNAADGKALDALAVRVSKMEETIKTLPAGDGALAERVSAADNAMKSLGLALTALNRRNEEIAGKAAQAQQQADAAEKAVSELRASLQDVSKTANAGASPAELQSLQQRVAALEQSAKTARAEIETAAASDKAARLALNATALRDAIARGTPFEDELAQAKSLGADESILGPLMPFATTGVPSEKALTQELRALLPALQKAADSPAPSGGFLERLQANAEHLVRIRPIDASPSDDPSAVLARIEADAAQDNVASALSDVANLPEPGRQVAADWVTRAVARQKALDAANRFVVDTARALGPR